jgi:hypothetical protein
LDLWAESASVAAPHFRPDSCAPPLASRHDLADARGDQLARERRAAVPRAAARRDNAVPADFTHVADWLQQRAATRAQIPDRIGFAFGALQARPALHTFQMRHRHASWSYDRA